VFLGDLQALIIFARQLWVQGITRSGQYQVIAVQVDPYDPDNKKKYLLSEYTVLLKKYRMFAVCISRGEYGEIA